MSDLPLPQNFQLHFNHRDSGRHSNSLNGDWRNGDSLEEQLIRQINAANEEVLRAVQELTLPQIANALIRAKHRRVRVQVVRKTTTAGPGRNSNPATYQLTAGEGSSDCNYWQTAIVTVG